MKFSTLSLDEKIEVINNSYEIANNNFNTFIANDVKNELISFTDITNKFNDLKEESQLKVNEIYQNLISLFESFHEDKRAYAKGNKNYLMVFHQLEVEKNEQNMLYSNQIILIFIHTLYQTLYFKIMKFYEKEIIKNGTVLVYMMNKGTLFNNKYGEKQNNSYILFQLELLNGMLALKKGFNDYFFYDALYIYGSMHVDKSNKLRGFVEKLRTVLSANRDSINKQIKKIPNRTFMEYLTSLDYTISKK